MEKGKENLQRASICKTEKQVMYAALRQLVHTISTTV